MDDYLLGSQLDFDNEFIVSTTKAGGSGRLLNARYNGNNIVMISAGRYRRDTNDLSFNGPYYDVKLNQQTLLSGLNQTTLYQDGALITNFNNAAYSLGNTDGLFIGIRADLSNEWEGALQEIIIYSSDQSANRTKIEDNINAYYVLYGLKHYRQRVLADSGTFALQGRDALVYNSVTIPEMPSLICSCDAYKATKLYNINPA